ncbi:MAG: bifunctional diaminohydroxyphosphoribosylaminopyrimidine deaminase/5-amino-6-(5-phosphoribosylamino)uracil reductase RibD [Syntrophobacteraceae bacterium]
MKQQSDSVIDRRYMKEALRLAVKGRGRTSPNPMVGAVVVQGDTIVGKGYHEYVGGPHGEVNALRDASEKTADATLYVTLEPCNHQGRTPPCTFAILDSGVSRVVIGMSDPNPHVKGKGADYLRKHGISVDEGILEKESRIINQAYIKYVTTGIPFVTLKTAATLDGRIATRTGDARWISNERSRAFVHRMRAASDGILVGINTVLEDDPMLTARIPKSRAIRQPIRIVLDSRLKIPPESRLVRSARDVPLWVACSEKASRNKEAELKEAGIHVLRLPQKGDRIDLHSLLSELGKRGLTSLLVEGGARVMGAFLESRLADEVLFFYAPKILGDPGGVPMVSGGPRDLISESMSVYNVTIKRFGEDVMLRGRLGEHLY